MQLKLDWGQPIPLKSARDDGLIYSFDPTEVPACPGIYVFGRKFGRRFEALYVGKAANLQKRTQQQLKNVRLMVHLEHAKIGGRVLVPGALRSVSETRIKTGIPMLEKSLIRYFMAEGHDLVNVHGIQIRRHEIINSGFSAIPETMFIDQG